MVNFASKLAKKSKKGDVFGLRGTLGSGKSFFVNAFVNALSNQKIEVTSPTFNLVNIYEIEPKTLIYHFDLYRLDHEEEIFNLGIEESFIEGITLVEWPEIASDFLHKNKNYQEIIIDIKNNNEREIQFIN